MSCCNCKKNDATMSYVEIKNGKRTISYYCMLCYQKLFLDEKAAQEEGSFTTCPYCETTLEEYRKSKIVGCGYCYRMMEKSLMPSIVKMQGQRKAHCGKTPPLDMETATDIGQYFDEDVKKEVKAKQDRLERQCNELTLIIQKLQKEGKLAAAKEYAYKLSTMKSKLEIEEEFVWIAP